MWWLLSCQSVSPPASCDALCVAAAEHQRACLVEWGVEWDAAGYEDEADFLLSCQTWAWEMSLLEADAVANGVLAQPGTLAETCTDWTTAYAETDMTCASELPVDWHTPPWLADTP